MESIGLEEMLALISHHRFLRRCHFSWGSSDKNYPTLSSVGEQHPKQREQQEQLFRGRSTNAKNKSQLIQLMAQIGLELRLHFSSAQLLFTDCPPCVRNYSLLSVQSCSGFVGLNNNDRIGEMGLLETCEDKLPLEGCGFTQMSISQEVIFAMF